jgi:hypothetical protein
MTRLNSKKVELILNLLIVLTVIVLVFILIKKYVFGH